MILFILPIHTFVLALIFKAFLIVRGIAVVVIAIGIIVIGAVGIIAVQHQRWRGGGTRWRRCGRWTAQRIMGIDEIGQIQIQFPHRDVNVIRIHAQCRVYTFGTLFQAFAVGTLQRYGLEQNDHNQIQTPYLVRLTQTVNASHFALLIGIGQDTYRFAFARYGLHEIFATFLGYVFA